MGTRWKLNSRAWACSPADFCSRLRSSCCWNTFASRLVMAGVDLSCSRSPAGQYGASRDGQQLRSISAEAERYLKYFWPEGLPVSD